MNFPLALHTDASRAGQLAEGSPSPNGELSADSFDWRAHFAERAKAAKARMLVRQSPPRAKATTKPPIPTAPWEASKPGIVYFCPPGPYMPFVPRQVYGCPIGPIRGRGAARGVIEAVCAKHRLPRSAIVGSSRKHNIVLARQECAWKLFHGLKLSLPEIGRHLGGRDHTTALHGIRAHQRRIDSGEIAA